MNNFMDDERLERSKPLFIVSDFHGVYDVMDLVKSKLIKGNRRVVVLGDCMDRGNEGIHILQEIKALSERGESIMYLPGNHDEVLYSKLRRFIELYRVHKVKNNMSEEMINDFISIFRNVVRTEVRFDILGKYNGQLPTFCEIAKMTEHDEGVFAFLDLMLWLEDQPLLAIETDCDGRKIALSHAAFDMELYKLDKPLTLKTKAMIDKRYEELESLSDRNIEEYERIKRLYNKAHVCLWYRNPNDTNSRNQNGIVTLPDESESDVIVVGHTPRQIEVKIIGENMTRTAIDVDGGTVECYLSGNGEILKFEPYRESLPSKVMVSSFITIGKRGAFERLGLLDEYEKSNDADIQEETDENVKIYIPKKKRKQNSDLNDGFGDI